MAELSTALSASGLSNGAHAVPPFPPPPFDDAFAGARSELMDMARVVSLAALSASIAHEVSQPLSGILTNASTCLRMLGADPPDIVGACETARRTVRDGKRACDVITRLRLLFSKRDWVVGSVDLSAMTTEVIALLRGELERKHIRLSLDLAPSLPPVDGDSVQLQQVILNLVLNAADAMSELEDRPRELIVKTESDDHDRVRLSVGDTGIGFEPGSQEKVFEPFFTTKSKGMGIGLAVSRAIVERHHGRLWAAPNSGPGVTFFMSFPGGIRMPHAQGPAPALARVPSQASSRVRGERTDAAP